MAIVSDPASTSHLILDATERLLARFGYQKMTMDDIAREAGISKRTIYFHFPSKEEVALSSIDRIVDRLLDGLRAIADAPGVTPDVRLRQMLRMRVLFRFDSVFGYHQSLDELLKALRTAYLSRREGYFRAEADTLAGVLREGVRQGLLTTADPDATAHALLLATNALLPYSLSPRELGKREDIEARVDHIADLLLTGLLRR